MTCLPDLLYLSATVLRSSPPLCRRCPGRRRSSDTPPCAASSGSRTSVKGTERSGSTLTETPRYGRCVGCSPLSCMRACLSLTVCLRWSCGRSSATRSSWEQVTAPARWQRPPLDTTATRRYPVEVHGCYRAKLLCIDMISSQSVIILHIVAAR